MRVSDLISKLYGNGSVKVLASLAKFAAYSPYAPDYAYKLEIAILKEVKSALFQVQDTSAYQYNDFW